MTSVFTGDYCSFKIVHIKVVWYVSVKYIVIKLLSVSVFKLLDCITSTEYSTCSIVHYVTCSCRFNGHVDLTTPVLNSNYVIIIKIHHMHII